jgi:phosphoglycolate phosphatase-like HAD superfamily hydrolase
MPQIRAAFFDVDGVLLDSLPAHLQICEELNRQWGLGLRIPSADQLRSMAHAGVRVSPMLHFFCAVGFSGSDARRADEYYQRHFAARYHPRPFPGIKTVLESVRDSGVWLGLVTANIRANVEQALGDAWHLFDPRLRYTADCGLGKAEALADGVRQLGIAPKEAVFVGDLPQDYSAARLAGTHFLGVSYGWGISSEDREFGVVERLEDLETAIRSIHT